jgi:phospholipid/cholesterol/gamma-HCH transport system permease protein
MDTIMTKEYAAGLSMREQFPNDQPRIFILDNSIIQCEGSWTLTHLPALDGMLQTFSWPVAPQLVWDTGHISAMDTSGAVLLHRTLTKLRASGKQVTVQGLCADYHDLLEMVASNWSRTTRPEATKAGLLNELGGLAGQKVRQGIQAVEFIGECGVELFRAVTTPSIIRWRAILQSLEIDGFLALPITGLLAFLMGVVIAYQGAEQLRQFGANIFVVDLVGVSILREIGPLIVAILIAGRSGSAYAAQFGTMKVTEELDAIRTLGLSPIQLLVLPRLCGLVIALPLLTVYADVLGVMGGALVAFNRLDLTFTEFVLRFEEWVALRHFLIGLGKAPFFAVIIAVVGCYQGFQIRVNVDDVGKRTTISVVQSIFLVIVFDALCSIMFSWWNI